jgi:uracil-DNA glycosylase
MNPTDELRDALRETRAYLKWMQGQNLIHCSAELEARLAAAPAAGPRKPQSAASPGTGGMDRVISLIRECGKCPLGSTRTNAVWGVGNVHADLMFIGEAPGAKEDEKGEPFVGPAGRVLTEELAKNGITREEVFITNIIKCRPPGNRDPQPDEIAACEPYLLEQIDLVKPKMLCALGLYAVATLLKRPVGIMRERGNWDAYHGVPLFICLHPSATLHSPANRPLFNGDIAKLAEAYRKARV